MKTVEYWREHPDEFAEEVFGLKLFPYQKKIIKDICGSSKRYIPMYSRSSSRAQALTLFTILRSMLYGDKYEETDRR